MAQAESVPIHCLRSIGASGTGTAAVLFLPTTGLPRLAWLGAMADDVDLDQFGADAVAAVGTAPSEISSRSVMSPSVAVLPEVSDLWLGRPGLAGFRLGDHAGIGRDWSTDFTTTHVEATAGSIAIDAADGTAGLALRTDVEAVAGGGLRMRHTVTNLGNDPYVVESLDVVVSVSDQVAETLDMTGRWAFERSPQRRAIADGVWLRENRGGRPNFDSPTMLVTGTPGFGFGAGHVWGCHLAWSGNTRHFVQRQSSGVVTMGGGELLLSGEVVLNSQESYRTPWLHVGASDCGLDELAAQTHGYLRSLPAHPRTPIPVVTNVWEAVYFDHDLDRLRRLADQSAAIGVERFVLDDGWFGARRGDDAGLGDWVVSADVWPAGLTPLVEHVTGLGMQFGLWFEPEMVNPDSDLYRAHPDWVLNTPEHEPVLARNQLVLDLGRPEVRNHLFDQMSAVLGAHRISFVKWDHNRLLTDAGSGTRAGGAGVHNQTLGFYELLDRLRAAHPDVEWESCASGGGRIDLEVLARTQRAWTSDMTDALARQMIQRWTGQLAPPEYLGAHVSAPTNHQTGRHFSLDFRAATAFFGSFGVEWDINGASDAERARLGEWITAYKRHRHLLHSGRVVRVDSGADDIWIHGVVADDRSEGLFAYVQLDEVVRDPAPLRCSGLSPEGRYTARQVATPRSEGDTEAPRWRGEGMSLSGAVLAELGLPAPSRRPLSSMLVHLTAD